MCLLPNTCIQHICNNYVPCRIIEHIGSGQFSEVEKAQWISDNGRTEVAIKTLHEDSSGRGKVRCLQEAAMMAQFHHPNVVTLHGIIRESHKVMYVLAVRQNSILVEVRWSVIVRVTD